MLAQGDERDAAGELESALASNPLQMGARRLLGDLHLRHHDLERAFLELQASTEAFPGDAEGWAGLAEVRLQAAQPEEAEAALTRAIESWPQRKDLRLRRAQVRVRVGRYHGAILDALAAGPGDAATAVAESARARLGTAACAPKRFQPSASEASAWPGALGEMIRSFAAATRRKDWPAVAALVGRARSDYPRTMLAPWLEGLSAMSSGDPEHGERALQEALAISPRSHRPITNLVALWSKSRGPGYAAERLLTMVALDPAFTYPLPIAAAAYVEEGQPARAEATIRKMFSLLPQSPLPFREVARFLLNLDRPSDAIATAAQGLVRFPADADLLREQARGYAMLGDRDSALRSWEETLTARPDDQDAQAELARLLMTVRKDVQSQKHALQLVRTLECDAPDGPDVLGAMGRLLLEAGDAPDARRWLQAASDRAPESSQLHYQLALAFSRTKDLAAARSELQEALRSGRPFDEEPEARRMLQGLEERGR